MYILLSFYFGRMFNVITGNIHPSDGTDIVMFELHTFPQFMFYLGVLL